MNGGLHFFFEESFGFGVHSLVPDEPAVIRAQTDFPQGLVMNFDFKGLFLVFLLIKSDARVRGSAMGAVGIKTPARFRIEAGDMMGGFFDLLRRNTQGARKSVPVAFFKQRQVA